MSVKETEDSIGGPSPFVSWRIAAVMFGLIVAGSFAFMMLREPPPPPPPEVAVDPLLLEGWALYLDRCVSCHGPSGRGDGPIAKGLAGPPPGDLADADWKHGDRPDRVIDVLTRGVPGSSMPGWKGILDPQEIQAVAAYVFYLAGRPVPDAFRPD